MIDKSIVCSLKTALSIDHGDSALVIRTSRPDRLGEIREEVRSRAVRLRCVVVETDLSLEEIPFDESWKGCPIALHIKRIGRYRTYSPDMPLLRELDIRIYVPADREENLTGLRILASLGVETAVEFTDTPPDWERVSDLMTYALLGLSPHAGIEPFSFIGEHYDPNKLTDFGTVYFDDPTQYLHLDEDGKVYVSPHDLRLKHVALDDAKDMDRVEETEAYRGRMEGWRQHFVHMDTCSTCPGWRLCGGAFSQFSKASDCSTLFGEMLDVVEQYQAITEERTRSVWQP